MKISRVPTPPQDNPAEEDIVEQEAPKKEECFLPLYPFVQTEEAEEVEPASDQSLPLMGNPLAQKTVNINRNS